MRLEPEFFDSFGAGVVSTAPADQLPATAAAWARDSALYDTVAGKCLIGKRRGASRLNATAVSAGAVSGQVQYKHSNGSLYHLLFSEAVAPAGPRVDLLNSDNSTTSVDTITLTAGGPFSLAVANDVVFLCNGTDKKKVRRGASAFALEGWGMTAPGAPTAADQGAGSMTGDYEFALTYENALGSESSLGTVLAHTAAASKVVRVSWSAPADAQVTYVRVHARKPTINSVFLQVARIAVATGQVDLDIADSAWSTYTILSPDAAENNPPPASIRACAYHLGRMFVVDKGTLYWSKQNALEAFDPEAYESVGKGDGQDCAGLLSVAENLLLVFKNRSVWGLQGTAPENWTLDRLVDDVGSTSANGARSAGGKILFWSELGPVEWTIGSERQLIGQDLLAGSIGSDYLNTARYNQVCAGLDTERQRVVWAVPSLNATRNDTLIPYRYKLGVFESSGWDLFDIASMCEGVNPTTGAAQLFLGNYSGRVFSLWTVKTDGGPAGLTVFSGTPTSGTDTTLTDSTAAFPTSPSLADTFVSLITTDGTVQRRRISGNTATELTITPSWDAVPTSGMTYVLSNPVFQLETGWQHNKVPFWRKRLMKCYLAALANGLNAVAYVDVFNTLWSTRPKRNLTFTVTSTGSAFDAANWDAAYFGEEGVSLGEKRVGCVGAAWKLRVRQFTPNTQFLLVRLGLQANLLSSKKQ